MHISDVAWANQNHTPMLRMQEAFLHYAWPPRHPKCPGSGRLWLAQEWHAQTSHGHRPAGQGFDGGD